MDELIASFMTTNFMPHGHCFLWLPGILWTTVIADVAIALAYFSIPIALWIFIKKRQDLSFRGVFVLFALFILCCGITHLVAVYNIWHGFYGLQAIVKAITAIVSVYTAIIIFWLLPKAMSIPSRSQLDDAISAAAEERERRHILELQQKSESIFKYTAELLPTGLVVVDQDLIIRVANRALERIFLFDENELIGQPLSILLGKSYVGHHDVLAYQYLMHPEQNYAMASGRIVRGKTKDGDDVAVEVTLSAHDFNGEKHVFASVINVSDVTADYGYNFEKTNRLHRAIEATNDGVWEWNPLTNDVWYSPRVLELIGAPGKATPNFDDWYLTIHPEDKSNVDAVIARHFENKKAFSIIYRGLIHGEYEWMHTRGNTLFDAENKPVLMSGILSNVNTIKKMEFQYEEKSKFLNAVLDRSLCGTYIYDVASRKNTFINAQYTKITGYTLADFDRINATEGMLSLFHPDEQKCMLTHVNNVIKDGSEAGLSIEYRFKHKQGHWIWCYSRDSVYSSSSNGEITEMLGVFFDITELKRRESEIIHLANKYASTFDFAAVGIAHLSEAGQCITVNSQLCNTLGYTKEDILSRNIRDFADLDKTDRFNLADMLIESGDRKIHVEQRFFKKNNQTVFLYITVSMVLNENGYPDHFIAVFEDITELKETEKNLAESNASLERFAYSASHDLQEPLRKISAFSDSLAQRITDKVVDADVLFELSRITDAVKRMRGMIDSLLELSRHVRSPLKRVRINFDVLCIPVLHDLSPLIKEAHAKVKVVNSLPIYVDTDSAAVLIRNLVVNAIRYASPQRPPEIELNIQDGHEFFEISCTDNGIGIEEKYRTQIFEPFRRLVGRDIPGSGMGLALCRQIVIAHGGSICVDSVVNNGSTFTILLPKGGL